MRFRLRRLLSALLSVPFIYAGCVSAQDYPNRPIRLIIPWPPGGGTDVTFRMWAPKLGEELGQQIVIDNRSGAGSIIGLDIVAKSQPDGYTLGASNIAFGANPFLRSKMPFDTEKDLVPVSMTAFVPMVLTVYPPFPAKSLKELLAMAKAKPGSINYGSAGNGSASHLVTELMLDVTGTKMVHVPYKGGAPANIAGMSGEVKVVYIALSAGIGLVKTGKLRPLAISTLKRHPLLSDVPTIAESIGKPDFQVAEWHGVVVPKGTPQAVISRLNKAIVKALHAPDVRKRIETAGAETLGTSPEEMAKYVKNELTRWERVIKAVGIRLD